MCMVYPSMDFELTRIRVVNTWMGILFPSPLVRASYQLMKEIWLKLRLPFPPSDCCLRTLLYDLGCFRLDFGSLSVQTHGLYLELKHVNLIVSIHRRSNQCFIIMNIEKKCIMSFKGQIINKARIYDPSSINFSIA